MSESLTDCSSNCLLQFLSDPSLQLLNDDENLWLFGVKVPLNPVRSLRARVFATVTLWQAAILGEMAVELEPAGHSQFRRPNSA